jgi:[acyl-carrier-protein] S-malonyltransferase
MGAVVAQPKTAYIFPGQGSQYLGMGQDFYDNFEIAAFVFYRANRILNKEFEKIIFGKIPDKVRDRVSRSHIFFKEDIDELGIKRGLKTQLDKQVQIATYITSWAAFCAFKERVRDEELSVKPELMAGHSFGEYAALTAAGVINYDTGLQLVNQREHLMISRAKDIDGGLVAIINKSRALTQEDVKNISLYGGREVLHIALYNSSKQNVFGGTNKNISASKQLLKDSEFRVIDVPVLGPWHTPLMNPASERLKAYIEEGDFSFKAAQIPIISNTLTEDLINPRVITRPDEVKNELVNQLDHPVLWAQTIRKMVEEYRIARIFIFGAGKITQRIINEEYPDVEVCRVEDIQTLEETIEEIKHPGRKGGKSLEDEKEHNT